MSTKIEQDRFNQRFLLKIVYFMFLYRTYSMYIDPEHILINGMEKMFKETFQMMDDKDLNDFDVIDIVDTNSVD